MDDTVVGIGANRSSANTEVALPNLTLLPTYRTHIIDMVTKYGHGCTVDVEYPSGNLLPVEV